MKVVSEDHSGSVISNLFRVVYGKNVYFCEGVSKIEGVVDDLIVKYPNEEILVYVDLVPGNSEIRKTFLSYTGKYRKNTNVYIVPIVCSEYCVLLSWISYGIIKDSGLINILNDGKWYGNYDNYSNKKSLEGFCKYILASKLPKECKVKAGDDEKINFYSESKCNICNNCSELSKRAVDFVVNHKAYIKNDVIDTYYKSLSCDNETVIREYLVMYNSLCEEYARYGNASRYKKFKLR